jgi:molybdopterin converting factor small subunit
LAHVVLTTELSRQFTGGTTQLEIEADSIRQVVRKLEERYPGLGSMIEQAGMMVAIDGEIYHDPFLERVKEDSEVCFMPPLGGG